MMASDYLTQVREFPQASLTELTGGLPFIVLSPHPDDESLGVGGLIALACGNNQNVNVVILTDGSASHPRSRLYPRQRLIDIRHAEVEQAARILGVPPDCTHFLGLPDTNTPTDGPLFDDAVGYIGRLAERMVAKTVFVTWRGDPHCDHEAAALIAEELRVRDPSVTLWSYPIWAWHLEPSTPVPRSPPRGRRIDISEAQSVKRAAIAAHVSQMTDLVADDPEGFRFTAETLAPFLGRYEYFIEVPE